MKQIITKDKRVVCVTTVPYSAAIVHWLNSEAEGDAEQNGLTEGQKDALLRTFLGRGGSGA